MLLTFAGLGFAQVAHANEGYGSAGIVSIDMKKKIIDFGDFKFKFDSDTVVYDVDGNRVSFSELKPGMSAKVGFDQSKRFVGYPTLQNIRLKSVIER